MERIEWERGERGLGGGSVRAGSAYPKDHPRGGKFGSGSLFSCFAAV